MKFKMYDEVRIKEGTKWLPETIKPGDIGLIDGVIFSPLGYYHVSFDSGSNHGITMQEDEIERIT